MKGKGQMCRVAFCLPYYPGRNHSQFVGIGYISSYIQNDGHQSLVLDEDAAYWVKHRMGSSQPKEDARIWVKTNILKFNPDIICVSINTANYKNALLLLKDLRKVFPGKCLVVGGPHISASWSTFSSMHGNEFDIAIIGEGEETLRDICRAKGDKEKAIKIPGTYVSGASVNLSFRSPIIDIDSLPFPDRQSFLMPYSAAEMPYVLEHYKRVFYTFLPGFKGKEYARIVATRGCNKKCGFCSPATYWSNPFNGYPLRRIRKPQYLIKEIEMLAKGGIEAVYFDDPSFPVLSDAGFFSEFKSQLKQKDFGVILGAPMSHDELSEDIIDSLFEMGFRYAYIGLESFDKFNLQTLGKNQNVQHCVEIVRMCSKKGIHCDISYQIGLPGDDLIAIERSIDWLSVNGLRKNVFFNITALWPETMLAKKYGITAESYEPGCDKDQFAKKGLYYFDIENDIDEYFSNCSGTFHFLPYEDVCRVKEILLNRGFFNRFRLTEKDYQDLMIK